MPRPRPFWTTSFARSCSPARLPRSTAASPSLTLLFGSDSFTLVVRIRETERGRRLVLDHRHVARIGLLLGRGFLGLVEGLLGFLVGEIVEAGLLVLGCGLDLGGALVQHRRHPQRGIRRHGVVRDVPEHEQHHEVDHRGDEVPRGGRDHLPDLAAEVGLVVVARHRHADVLGDRLLRCRSGRRRRSSRLGLRLRLGLGLRGCRDDRLGLGLRLLRRGLGPAELLDLDEHVSEAEGGADGHPRLAHRLAREHDAVGAAQVHQHDPAVLDAQQAVVARDPRFLDPEVRPLAAPYEDFGAIGQNVVRPVGVVTAKRIMGAYLEYASRAVIGPLFGRLPMPTLLRILYVLRRGPVSAGFRPGAASL